MSKLRLPLWVISERNGLLHPPEHIPCDAPRAAHAFSTAERMAAFVGAQQGGRWKLDLSADLDSLAVVISELHEAKISQLCVDAEPDGSGGTLMNVSDVYSMCRSQE